MYFVLDKGNFGFPCVVFPEKSKKLFPALQDDRCAGEAQK